jgi:DNA-binding NarL/FixJ family response regulator
VIFFGTEEPRTAAAAIAAGARGVIRADHNDPVTLVAKAVLLLLAPARPDGGGPESPDSRAVPADSPARTGTTVLTVPHQPVEAVAEPPRRRIELTGRELQVLKGMADGKSNAEIGRDLYVSEDTVKTHARRLFRKLGARDRAHAVASAFRAGLVS